VASGVALTAEETALFISAYEIPIFSKARLDLVFNAVLTIFLVNPPALSVPRSLPSWIAGITQGESIRISDLDAAPEPNANSADVRSSGRRRPLF
jgi:hypothetical protein